MVVSRQGDRYVTDDKLTEKLSEVVVIELLFLTLRFQALEGWNQEMVGWFRERKLCGDGFDSRARQEYALCILSSGLCSEV